MNTWACHTLKLANSRPCSDVKTADFDYLLPEERIAQTPAEPRDSSRLLVLDRCKEGLDHTTFREIGAYLHPGDLLVINHTRVIPARVFAHKDTGGRVELLLLRREDLLTWEALVGGKRMVAGRKLVVEGGPRAEIIQDLSGSPDRPSALAALHPRTTGGS